MSILDCENLFQIEKKNNDFITNWKALEQKKNNCVPNVLFFLNILNRDDAKQLVEEAECGIEQAVLKDILKAFEKKNIKVNTITTAQDPTKEKKGFFNLMNLLHKNNVTFLGGNRLSGIGHGLAIGRNNDNKLMLFDPQQSKLYQEQQITQYLKDQQFITYTYFCTLKKNKTVKDKRQVIIDKHRRGQVTKKVKAKEKAAKAKAAKANAKAKEKRHAIIDKKRKQITKKVLPIKNKTKKNKKEKKVHKVKRTVKYKMNKIK